MRLKNLLNAVLVSLILAVIAQFSFAATNKTINADIITKRIPEGTTLKLQLLNPISSENMQEGDPFNSMVTEDVKVNKSIVIPVGSMIRGSIEKVKPKKMLSKGATIYLNFDHVVSPTGKQVPLNVGIYRNKALTYDGGLSSKTNYGTATVQNAHNTAKIVKTCTKWGWETGDKTLNGYPKFALAPISAIVSVPAAGIYFIGDSIVDIFKKGDDIIFNQGDELQVMLVKPLDMPVY